MKVGILALQGAFAEHLAVLERLDVESRLVRVQGDLEELEGLVIPGGESTTMSRLMMDFGLLDPIKKLAEGGFPILGTCAGMILMAREVAGFPAALKSLSIMDVAIRRNAFGSQVDSFEADLDVPVLGREPFNAVFIRAPVIERVGEGVEVLAAISNGRAVAARQGNLVAVAFHPELTTDPRLHRYFLDLVSHS